MKSINGITPSQMIEFLKSYRTTPANDLLFNNRFICKYIFNEFVKGRSRVLLADEAKTLKKDIWQFIAHWYVELGYRLPIDAGIDTELFDYCENEVFYFKVQERKEFVRLLLDRLEKSEELWTIKVQSNLASISK